MKKLMTATAAAALLAGSAFAGSHNEVKIGVILGFTGPLETITPAMGAGAELAMKEVTDSGKLPLAEQIEMMFTTKRKNTTSFILSRITVSYNV